MVSPVGTAVGRTVSRAWASAASRRGVRGAVIAGGPLAGMAVSRPGPGVVGAGIGELGSGGAEGGDGRVIGGVTGCWSAGVLGVGVGVAGLGAIAAGAWAADAGSGCAFEGVVGAAATSAGVVVGAGARSLAVSAAAEAGRGGWGVCRPSGGVAAGAAVSGAAGAAVPSSAAGRSTATGVLWRHSTCGWPSAPCWTRSPSFLRASAKLWVVASVRSQPSSVAWAGVVSSARCGPRVRGVGCPSMAASIICRSLLRASCSVVGASGVLASGAVEALSGSANEPTAASGSLSSLCERSASPEAVLTAAGEVGRVRKLKGQVPAQRGAGSVGSTGAAVGLSGTAALEATSPAVWDEREEGIRGLQVVGERPDRQVGSGRQQVRSDRAAKKM